MNKNKYTIIIVVTVAILLSFILGYFWLIDVKDEAFIQREVGEESERVATEEWERGHYNQEKFIQEYISLNSEDREFISEKYDSGDKFSSLTGSTEDLKYILVDSKSKGRLDFYTLDSETGELDIFLKLNRNKIKNVSDHEHDINFDYYLEGLQGNQLIVFKIDEMDSLGPCFSSWVYVYENPTEKRSIDKCVEDGGLYGIEDAPEAQLEDVCKVRVNTRVLYSLRLDSLEKGLNFYEVSKEKYEQKKKEVEECIESIGETEAAPESLEEDPDIFCEREYVENQDFSLPIISFNVCTVEQDGVVFEHTTVEYKETDDSDRVELKTFIDNISVLEALNFERELNIHYLSDSYLIIKKIGLPRGPQTYQYNLLGLGEHEGIEIEMTGNGEPVFHNDEKYLVFQGYGGEHGGGETLLKMINGEVVRCLIANGKVSDLEVKNEMVTFKEETWDHDKSEYVTEDKSLHLKELCDN